MECKHKSNANKNRGKWNHLKIIEKITGQHTGEARNQGNTK